MRLLVTPLTLLLGVSILSAQEQEAKLVGRLLKPDLSLKNPAQDKQFKTASALSTDKHLATPGVIIRAKPPAKAFPDPRAFPAKQIGTHHFRRGETVADVTPRSRPIRTDAVNRPPDVTVQLAPESDATSPTRQFAGNRQFLVEGKSQKALRTKNKPLTIDQVRELLNKSK